MTAKNKVRGNNLEREIVKYLGTLGVESKRAWGSNGNAIGQHQEVDILVKDNFKLQVKRKKKLPDWLGMTEHVDAVVFREDGKQKHKYIMLRLEDFVKKYLR